VQRAAWMVAVVAACGRIDFSERAVADATLPGDASCTWSAFDTPQPLPGPIQSVEDDWAPTPTLGGLELYFYSFRSGGPGVPDLWFAVRSDPTGDFGSAELATELDTPAAEGTPTLTDDALDIVFERDDSMGIGDLYEATRSNVSDAFGSAAPVDALNTTSAEGDPFESADGLRIVFASARTGDTGLDLFESTRASLAAPFAAPVALGTLNSDVDEESPTLSADALDIYFASDRPAGLGGLDIYTAHRVSVDEPFGTPALVPELSSSLDDVNVRLSRDGRTMYVNYDTETSGGDNASLDFATRTCQ
jgi:hypothetical protein